MKQTNNAIKFLMAQYRSIFKNAYFKGLTTAMVVTAGLAAGQSQATTLNENINPNPLITTQPVNIGANDDDYSNIHGSFSGSWNATVNIRGGKSYTVDSTQNGNCINIKGADLSGTGLNIDSGAGLLILAVDASQSGNFSTINVNNGTLDINYSGSTKNTTISVTNGVTIGTNGTVNLNGQGASSGSIVSGSVINNGIIAFKGADTAGADAVLSGTIAGEGTLDFQGYGTISAVTGKSGSNLDIKVVGGNALLSLGSAAGAEKVFQTNGDIVLGKDNSSGKLTIADSTLNLGEESSVTATSGSAIVFSGTKATTVLAGKLNGDVDLLFSGTAATPITDGGTIKAYTDEDGINTNITVEAENEAILDLSKADGDTFKVTSGTIELKGNSTASSGGAKLTINDGTLELGEEAILTATVDDTDTTRGSTLTLEANAGTTPNAANAVLKLSSKQLIDFLESDGTDKSGSVSLTKGTIYLTDGKETAYDLYKLKDYLAASATVGKIAVTDGIFQDNYLEVSDNLGLGSNLTVKANETLTLGGGEGFTSNGSTGSDLGFKEAIARNVVFKNDKAKGSGDTTFTLRNPLTLSAVDSVQDETHNIANPFDSEDTAFEYAGTGTITGDVIVTSSGPLTIEAGHYVNGNDITLSSSSLNIGGKAKVDTSLVQRGDLTLNGGVINVSGTGNINFNADEADKVRQAKASLDLTDADISLSGSGNQINVTQGEVSVTGQQIADLLDIRNVRPGNRAGVLLNEDATLEIISGKDSLQGFNGTALEVDRLNASTSASAGKISFNGDGSTLKADRVWLGADKAKNALNIGQGTIVADDVILDQRETDSKNTTSYKDFSVNSGKLIVGQSLGAHNGSGQGNALVFNGVNSSLQLGYIVENTDDQWGLKDGTYTTSSDTGSVTKKLVLSGGKAITDKPTLDVVYGSWQATQGIEITNGELTVGNEYVDTDANGNKSYPYPVSLESTDLTLNANASAAIAENGSVTVDTLALNKNAQGINIYGQMTVNGKAASEDTPNDYGVKIADGDIKVTGKNAMLTFENDVVRAITVNQETGKLSVAKDVFSSNSTNHISVSGLATLKLAFDNSYEFTEENLRDLRSSLLANSTSGMPLQDGYIHIGEAKIGGLVIDGNKVDWSKYNGFEDILTDVRNDDLDGATLINVNKSTIVSANVGNIRANGSAAYVQLGDATLSNSSLNNDNNNFIFNEANPSVALDAQILSGATVGLYSGGNVGAVTMAAGSEGDQTTLFVSSENEAIPTTFKSVTGANGEIAANTLLDINGATEVAGNVAVDSLNVNQSLDVKGNTTVNRLTSSEDGSTKLPVNTGNITATNLTVNNDVVYGGSITATGDVKIAGGLNADAGKDKPITAGKLTAKNLTVGGTTHYFGDMAISNKATFGGETSLLGNNVFKDVDIESAGTFGFYAMPDADGVTPAYSTSIETLTFKGDGNHELEIDDGVTLSAGVIQGKKADSSSAPITIHVGTDAGSDAEDSWDASTGYLMADRIDLAGGVLQADPEYGQAVTIVTAGALGSKAVTDATSAGELDGTIGALQNSIVAIGVDRKDADGNDVAVANVRKDFEKLLESGSLQADKIGSILYVAKSISVKDGSKLVADAKVSNSSPIDTTKYDGADAYIGANSAIAVNATSAQQEDKAAVNFQKAKAQVYADKDAKIVLVGNFDTNKAVKVFADTEDGVEFASGSATSVTVTSASGVYEGTMVADAETGFISDDVSLKYIGSGDNNGDANTPNPWAGVSNPVRATLDTYAKFVEANPDYDHDSDFLYYALRDDVVSAEKVARLGAFGGAAQAAIAAGSTTYEAVSGRMGVGAAGANITVADNTQGAALWLTPVYKNRDSDGFGADGVDYGTDLDLYGVALGADYTLANGFKIGAAFNIGSGDADGNGAGDGVSNDFDYYGFAVYGGYTYGPWSVVADISYTNVDNDVDVTTGLGKFATSFDSSNLSVGVTAQYQAVLDGDVTVTPHAGLRYTKIDLDDYTVKYEDGDTTAAYSSDDLSIFSIPFGVTVAKEFVNGTWTVKPSFDLTLTANMGDDSADGSVNWGITGLENTAVSSEVLDNFTYGATVGVAAKSGNFSLGFGLNYTGSSNTDEFGVNANARFVF